MNEIVNTFNALPVAGQMTAFGFQMVLWVGFLTVLVAAQREHSEALVKLAWTGFISGVFCVLQGLWVVAIVDYVSQAASG